MVFDHNIHHRRSIRLNGFDDAQAAACFVTICSQNRECLFGHIAEGEIYLSAAGHLIHTIWQQIPTHYPGIDIAECVVMPNHIYGIILINTIVGAGPRACPGSKVQRHPIDPRDAMGPRDLVEPPKSIQPRDFGQARGLAPTGGLSLPDAVHRFKTMTTKRYADGVKQSAWPPFPGRLWQRNYWEHIIRNEADHLRIIEYIQNNPARWAQDRLNPKSPHP
jgi:putative transposase